MTFSEYLSGGALIQILKRGGGGTPPCVWITQDTDGTYHYVFTEPTVGIGGTPVPFQTVEKNKIFRDKREAVTAYLQTFGLSKPEAEHIVEHIGTEPPDSPIPND